eukprot:4224977-Amphidinium_carterae.1
MEGNPQIGRRNPMLDHKTQLDKSQMRHGNAEINQIPTTCTCNFEFPDSPNQKDSYGRIFPPFKKTSY